MVTFYSAFSTTGTAVWLVAHEEEEAQRPLLWLTEDGLWRPSNTLEQAFYSPAPQEVVFFPLKLEDAQDLLSMRPRLNPKTSDWLVQSLLGQTDDSAATASQVGLYF